MFNYNVLTEEEAMQARFQLLPDGQYQATITKAEKRLSSSGNDMLVLDLDVYDKQGRTHKLKDYLLFTDNMIWKTRHAADSAGIMDAFEQKKITPSSFENKNVVVSVRTQKGNVIPFEKLKGKPEGSTYPDKNVVDDYVKRDEQAAQAFQQDPGFLNDDVPFFRLRYIEGL